MSSVSDQGFSNAELYPEGLLPGHEESIRLLDNTEVRVPVVNLTFNIWKGESVRNTFGGKPIVEFDGKPMFAELAIQRMAVKGGWSARWVEVYYLKNNEPYYLTEWQDLPGPGFKQVTQPLESPFHQSLLSTINEHSKSINATLGKRKISPYSGCWDVLAWKGEKTLFLESKHSKKDRIGDNQRRWLAAGLAAGLKPHNFLMVEWRMA